MSLRPDPNQTQHGLRDPRVVPMQWNTREKLALVTAVARLGEQAWPAVSRMVRSICNDRREFTQQTCARQYHELLEEFKDDISRDEPTALALCRRFTYLHLGELRNDLMDERRRYFYLVKQEASIDQMNDQELEQLYEELTSAAALEDNNDDGCSMKDYLQVVEALQFILNRVEAFVCEYSSSSSSILTLDEDDESILSDDEQEEDTSEQGVDDSSKPVSTAGDVTMSEGDEACTASRMTNSLSSEREIAPGQLRRSARLASSLRERERNRQNQVRKEITRLWKRVWLMPEASPFLRPLPTAVMKKSLYGKLVKKPVDLSTIRKQIKSGEIGTSLELRREMMQMVTNALIYERTRVARGSKETIFCPDLKEKAMAILRVINSTAKTSGSTVTDSQENAGRRRRSPKRVGNEGFPSKRAKQ